MLRERPILFSTPMVLALLSGVKTQTRRIVKPQPFNGRPDNEVRKQMIENGALGQDESLVDLLNGAIDHGLIPEARCPYGKPGDRLWVRWASRIALEIVGVRVERVQDISDDDARAEGVYPTATGLYAAGQFIEEYRLLWESINGPGSWDAWVIEFKRVTSG